MKCNCQCKHEDVRYCDKCSSVHCTGCGKTWQQAVSNNDWLKTAPVNPWQPNWFDNVRYARYVTSTNCNEDEGSIHDARSEK